MIVAINSNVVDFAEKVKERIAFEGFFADIDSSSTSLGKKIRNAQLSHYNFVGVIGNDEFLAGNIDLRDRDSNKSIGKFRIGDLLNHFKSLLPVHSNARKIAKTKV